MKTLLPFLFLAAAIVFGQANGFAQPQANDQTTSRQARLLTTIAAGKMPEEKLLQAVAQLQMPANEPPQYWSRIANDAHYQRFQRRMAVYQLFKRHVHVGMRLSELNPLLQRPTWLRTDDISVFKELIGKIPVHWNFDDTVLVIRFLPDPHKDVVGVYLHVAGKVDLQLFQDLLLKSSDTSVNDSKIVEIGSDWPRPR
jgi:hypothetical protein